MNQKIREKLKSEQPEYYDNTESAVAVISKPIIREALSESHRRGTLKGNLLTLPGIVLALLIPLVTVKEENFDEFLGIGGAVWRALVILSLVSVLFLALFLVRKLFRPNRWEALSVEEFFRGDKRIGNGKTPAQNPPKSRLKK